MENGARKIKLIRRRFEPATDYQKAIGVNPPPIGYIYEFERARKYFGLFLKLDLHSPNERDLLDRLLQHESEMFGYLLVGGGRRYQEEQAKLRTLLAKPAIIFSDQDWAIINNYARQMIISFHYGRPLLIAPGFVILMYFQLAMEKSGEQFVEREKPNPKLPENCDTCVIKNCPAYRSSEFYQGIPDDCPLINDSTERIRQNLIEDVNLSIALQHRKAGLTRLESQVSTLRAQGKVSAEIAAILKKDRGQITRVLQSSEKKMNK